MKLNCTIKVKHNFKNINTMIQKLPQTISESIEDILKNIRGYAIKLERGHNQDGILCELIDMSTNEIKGRVYATPDKFMIDDKQSYLWFEYFGTGQFAEKEHVGTTKHFKETGYTEWYIPKGNVKRPLSYPIKIINGKEFYVATGSKANHFLTDAEFTSRNENAEMVQKKIKEMFKEVCK